MSLIKGGSAPIRTEDMITQIQLSLSGVKDWSGNSSIVAEYEMRLAGHFDVAHAIAVSSGTAALHAALAAVGIKANSRVMLPAVGAVMTAAPIVALGAVPHFVDVLPGTFVLDHEAVRRELSSAPIDAILTCGLWGNPGCSQEVRDLARDFGIPVVEDAAQSAGSVSQGVPEGIGGTLGCFSTHDYKLIATGEGGFVLTNDLELAATVRSFIRIGFADGEYGRYAGLNYKLSAPQAAAGIHSLSGVAQRMAERQQKAQLWKTELSNYEQIKPLSLDVGSVSSGYAFIGLLTSSFPLDAAEFADRLYDQGIETDYRRYKFRLLQDYPLFSSHRRSPELLKNAGDLVRRLVVLPTHSGINLTDIPTLAKQVATCLFDVAPQP